MSFAAAADSLRLFLSKIADRSKLSPEEQQAMLRLPSTPRRVAAHGEIVRLGEHVEQVCLVADGLVARLALLEDGRRQLISLHIAGDVADLYSLMLPAAPAPVVALSPAAIFQIPHAALRDLAFRHPAVAAALWREGAIDGTIVAQWLVSVGRRDARGRLAHLICEMAVRSSRIGRYRGGRFPFPITQEQLADALGLTSVHVNRSLKGLREDGLAQLHRGEAAVLDWRRLSDAAEFDPDYLHLPPLHDALGSAAAGPGLPA